MKLLSKSFLILLTITTILSSCSQSLEYKKASSVEQCEENGGYWYNSRCWKDFVDEGISNLDIDSTVLAQIKVIDTTSILINNKKESLIGFIPMEEGKYTLLITIFSEGDKYKTMVLPVKSKKLNDEKIDCKVMQFNGNALNDEMDKDPEFLGRAEVKIIDMDKGIISVEGKLKSIDESKTKNFKFISNNSIIGSGNSILKIKNNEAYLSGTLGTVTYLQIKNLIKDHPEVRTIVMTKIKGSINDAVNMHTGRLIHENGFTTKVLSNADIASGGVDLFCAGTKRIVVKGAKIGVHSWCCVNGKTAIEIPKEHPAHKYQIEYFSMAMGADIGTKFYFYTLHASPFDSVHYMSDDEIKKWGVSTEFIEE